MSENINFVPGSVRGALHPSHLPAEVPAVGQGVTPAGERAIEQAYRMLRQRAGASPRRVASAPAVAEARRAFFAGR